MALPSGGLVRITVNQTQQLQQVRNVFWYRAEDAVGGDAAVGIGETFWNHVQAQWRAFVPTLASLTFESVDVRFMDGDEDYGTYLVPEAQRNGTRSPAGSQLLPVFCAANITLNPANRQVRPGSKRIGGLLEVDNNANNVESSALTLLQNLAARFTQQIVSGVFLDTLTPVVVGLPTETRPGRLLVPIVSAQVSRTLTTQNSRKLGRGI